ncbi:MAG: glycosyltransferase family 39 protein [Candidatus Levybacteria bacterium]|nr:glycosyltransferase family 39 protein [Candidatus Levybacteria bacterium]
MKKLEIIALFSIILGAFALRLYKFNAPIGDWHSWRQTDTSAVSRNFVKDGFDVLHPKFDDLSMGVSLKDNPQGYRFVEFPIYNTAQAALFKYLGGFTIEQWGRLVTIFSSLASIVFIYLLVKKHVGKAAALFAAFFFAALPYNIYFGRVILPDPSMVMAILGGIYFFDLWVETAKLRIYSWKFILAVVFTASSFLLKPFALFFTLPMFYLAFNKFGITFFKKWQLWVFFIISLFPLGFWQVWMRQYSEGIPRNDWLLNGNNIRFKGSFFHWLFGQRIGKIILGYFGLPIVALGILRNITQKEGWFSFSFLASSLLFMSVVATGNVQHDYYQILIIPTLSIFFGKGADMILRNAGGIFNRYISLTTLVIFVGFMLAFSWFEVRDFYNIQHPEIIQAGKTVDEAVPKDAKVLAPYGGDTTLLYYTKRKGWPVFDRSLPRFIKEGAQYMVFVNPTEPELNFKNYFVVLSEGDKYIVYDLTKPLKPIK